MAAEALSWLGYHLAALLVATLPAAILYWLLIHPLAPFWRRLGKLASFSLVGIVCLAVAAAIFARRDALLAVHWGYRWPRLLAGAALYVLGAVGEVHIRRRLTLRILVGTPELDATAPGKLLVDGPFARSRNPRYVNLVVALTGWALMLNYPALYLTLALFAPALYLVVRLEERELRRRFGAEYVDYCRRVPRFLPRGGWLF